MIKNLMIVFMVFYMALTEAEEIELCKLLEDDETYEILHPREGFYPNDPQLDLIHALSTRNETGKRRFMLTCANRTGKTTIISVITAAIITEDRSFFFSLFPEWDYAKTCWIIADADNVSENVLPILNKYLKGTKYITSKKRKPFDSHYLIPETGWEIHIRTYSQALESFESGTVGLIVFDEPPPFEIWKAVKSRLMQGGILLCGGTPLFGAGYLFDEVKEPAENDPESIYWHQTASMFDNVIEDAGQYTKKELLDRGYKLEDVEHAIGKNKGNITKYEAEVAIKEIKDPDEYRARVHGEFMFLSGAILNTFRPKTHVINDFKLNVHDYQIIQVIDPHNRRPAFIQWIAISRSGTKYIIDEWPRQQESGLYYDEMKDYNGNIQDVCSEIKRIEHENGLHIVRDDIYRIMDPNFGAQKQQNTGRTVMEEYAFHSSIIDYELFYEPGNNDFDHGLQVLKDHLKPDEYGDPRIFVFRKCKNTIRAFTYWKWKEHRGLAQEDKPKSERASELHKDAPDCTRYALATNFEAPPTKKVLTWREKALEEKRKVTVKKGSGFVY